MGARPVEPQDRQAHHCRRRRTDHVSPRGDGLELHGANLLQAVEWLQGGARRMGEWYARGFDLLLSPTIAEPPPLLGEFVQRPDNPLQAIFRAASIVPFTPPYNATGQPAMSVPLVWSEAGLPIGVQFAAPYGREDVLLRLAAQLEEARPWKDRR